MSAVQIVSKRDHLSLNPGSRFNPTAIIMFDFFYFVEAERVFLFGIIICSFGFSLSESTFFLSINQIGHDDRNLQ